MYVETFFRLRWREEMGRDGGKQWLLMCGI
jgi:hypothetical protein